MAARRRFADETDDLADLRDRDLDPRFLPEPEPFPVDPLDRVAPPDTGDPHPIHQTVTPDLPEPPAPAPAPVPPPAPVQGLAPGDRAGAGAQTATGSYQQVSGWEIDKLNDLSHQSPKYVFMRGVQDLGLPAIGIGDGAGDRGAMSQSLGSIVSYVQAHGFPNAHQAGDDSIDFGDGFGPIDVLTSQGQWWWGPGSAGTSPAPSTGGTGAGTGTGTGAGASGGGDTSSVLAQILAQLTGGSSQGQPGQFGLSAADQAFRDQILASLKQIISESGQSIGDVSQGPEAQAYSRAIQRGEQQARSAALEHRASQGQLFSGAADTDILGLEQQGTEAQAQFEATLTHNLLSERKDRLERALSLGAGFISSEQQFQLQSQLQATNAALAQNAQRLQLLSSLLQNQQYYDNLSFLYDQLVANQNTQAVPQ